MNDVKFNISAVEAFQVNMRNLGREVVRNQTELMSALASVSNAWHDESMVLAKNKVTVIDRKIKQALTEIDNSIATALRRQLEWAQRYNRIC